MKEKIKIAERFVPFTHHPGSFFMIPDSLKIIQIFPAALYFVENDQLMHLPVEGPVKNFTALYDLERQRLQVFGHAKNGYFSYFLKGDKFYLDKGSDQFLEAGFLKGPPPLSLEKETFERISFGITKKSEWDLVLKRRSLAEILPFIFLQGQQMKDQPVELSLSIAKDLEISIEKREIKKIEENFLALFQTGFRGVLTPQAKDSLYQGFLKPPISSDVSCLIIPRLIYQKLRSTILSEEQMEIAPLIMKLFPSGRALNLKTFFGKIDLEWTKGKLRKMFIHSGVKTEISIKFPKPYVKFRLDKKYQNLLDQQVKIKLEPEKIYFFDQFC